MGKSKELATFTDVGGTISGDLTVTERLEVNTSTNPYSSFPSGNWAGKIYNNLDAPNEGGLVVANRWAAGASTALLVGGLYDAGDGFDEFLKVDGVGRVTMPYQPSFHAYDGQSVQSGDVTVTYTQLLFNDGNCYNSTNGRFTAPVTGTYMFACYIQPVTTTYNTYSSITFRKNGSTYGTSELVMTWDGGGDHEIVGGTTLMKMSAGDYCDVRASRGYRGIQGHFCGYLLG